VAQSQSAKSPRVRHRRLVYPEGSRPYFGALLLGYYADDGKLAYAGRVGTGMPDKVLADLRRRLQPLARKTAPLNVLPPRKTRFGSPLVLSRVHWVEPKLVLRDYISDMDGRQPSAAHSLCWAPGGQAGRSGTA
jgi:ATP-dependent DNA ligase